MSAKPQEPEASRPRQTALAKPLLDAVVSPNEPTSARAGSSEPDIEPLLVALHLGVLDAHLAQIAQVVNTRLSAIDAVEELMASSRLHVSATTSDPSTSTAEVRPSSPGMVRSGSYGLTSRSAGSPTATYASRQLKSNQSKHPRPECLPRHCLLSLGRGKRRRKTMNALMRSQSRTPSAVSSLIVSDAA